MQRSEVLRVIESYGLSKEYAIALLEDLEFIGILPPDYYIKYDENGKYVPHFNYWTIVKNEWEPENET